MHRADIRNFRSYQRVDVYGVKELLGLSTDVAATYADLRTGSAFAMYCRTYIVQVGEIMNAKFVNPWERETRALQLTLEWYTMSFPEINEQSHH